MASGWTDKGVARMMDITFRGATAPTTFYLFLATNASTPGTTTNFKSELTEIVADNGYTAGGVAVPRNNTTGFNTLNEADPVVLQLADVVYTALGGSIPASGAGARWAILTDDNVTLAAREVWAFFDLGSDRTVSDGQSLTIQAAELQGDLP